LYKIENVAGYEDKEHQLKPVEPVFPFLPEWFACHVKHIVHRKEQSDVLEDDRDLREAMDDECLVDKYVLCQKHQTCKYH
jgi:hypothetical protein